MIGEHRFVGLFTSSAYSARVAEMPLLRGKVEASPSAPACRPAATWPRRCTTSWRPIRATSCSRSPTTSCYETALGILRARRAPAAAPVHPARPVRALRLVPGLRAARDLSRPTCALKFQHILMAAFAGTSAEFDVLLSRHRARAHPLHGAHRAAARCRPSTAGARAQAGRGGAPLGRRPARRADRGRGRSARHSALFKRWSARLPAPPTASACRARAAVRDVRKIDGADAEAAAGAGALPAARRGAERRCGFKVYRLGAPVVLSDSLPMLEHMGVRVLGEDNYRDRRGDGASRSSLHDFELQAQAAERDRAATRWRACSRTPSRACSAARSRTTTSTA